MFPTRFSFLVLSSTTTTGRIKFTGLVVVVIIIIIIPFGELFSDAQ